MDMAGHKLPRSAKSQEAFCTRQVPGAVRNRRIGLPCPVTGSAQVELEWIRIGPTGARTEAPCLGPVGPSAEREAGAALAVWRLGRELPSPTSNTVNIA